MDVRTYYIFNNQDDEFAVSAADCLMVNSGLMFPTGQFMHVSATRVLRMQAKDSSS